MDSPTLEIEVKADVAALQKQLSDIAANIQTLKDNASIEVNMTAMYDKTKKQIDVALADIKKNIDLINKTPIDLRLSRTTQVYNVANALNRVNDAAKNLNETLDSAHGHLNAISVGKGLFKNLQKELIQDTDAIKKAIGEYKGNVTTLKNDIASISNVNIAVSIADINPVLSILHRLTKDLNLAKASINKIHNNPQTAKLLSQTMTATPTDSSAAEGYVKALEKINVELEKIDKEHKIKLEFDSTNVNSILSTIEHAVIKLNLAKENLAKALSFATKTMTAKPNTINVDDRYFEQLGKAVGESVKKIDFGKQIESSFEKIDFKSMAAGINTALEKVYQQDAINRLPIVPDIDEKAIKGLKTRLTNLLKEIKEQTPVIPIELTLDITKFNDRLKVARNALDRFIDTKRFKPPLNMDLESFYKKLKTARESLKKFGDSNVTTVKLKLAIDDASAALESFNQVNGAGLADRTINVSINYAEFDKGISHIKRELESLKDKTVTINSNVIDVVAKERLREQELKAEKAERKKKEKEAKEQKPAPDSKENYQSILEVLKAHPLSNGINPDGNTTLEGRLKSVKMLQSAIELGKTNPNDPNAFLVGLMDEGFLRAQREWLEKAIHAVGANKTVSQAQKAMRARLKDPNGYNALIENLMAFPLSDGKNITTTATAQKRLAEINKLLSVHALGLDNPTSPRSWTATPEQLQFLNSDKDSLIEKINALAKGMSIEEYREYNAQQAFDAKHKADSAWVEDLDSQRKARQKDQERSDLSASKQQREAQAAEAQKEYDEAVKATQRDIETLSVFDEAYKGMAEEKAKATTAAENSRKELEKQKAERQKAEDAEEVRKATQATKEQQQIDKEQQEYNRRTNTLQVQERFEEERKARKEQDEYERRTNTLQVQERFEEERKARKEQDEYERRTNTLQVQERFEEERKARKEQQEYESRTTALQVQERFEEERKARKEQEEYDRRTTALMVAEQYKEQTQAIKDNEKAKKDLAKAEERLLKVQSNLTESYNSDTPMSEKVFMRNKRQEDKLVRQLQTADPLKHYFKQFNNTYGDYLRQFAQTRPSIRAEHGLPPEQLIDIDKVEKRLEKVQAKLAASLNSDTPMSEKLFMQNKEHEEDLLQQLAFADPQKYPYSNSLRTFGGNYKEYLDWHKAERPNVRKLHGLPAEAPTKTDSLSESNKTVVLEERRKRIAHAYSQELQKQYQLIKSGREITQQDIDTSERRIASLKRQWNNAYKGEKEEDIPQLRASYFNSTDHAETARKFNQERASKNAMAWQAQYFTTANSKVSALTSSLERLYTELKKDPGNVGIKKYIEQTAQELREARKEAKKVNEAVQAHGDISDLTKGWGHKLEWITGAFGFNESYDVVSEFANTITEIDEAMGNLATVMPELHDSEVALAKEQTAMIETATKYGEVINDTIESARLWGRMYKEKDVPGATNLLTEQSVRLAVADNFSLEESTKAVEAAMFQYGLTATSAAEALAYSNRIIDVYTMLSHNAGVSAQDLAAGVERSGAAANQAGVDFEFLTAMIAQGTRSTALSGSAIGTMLKTLVASLRSDKAVTELEKINVKVKETTEGIEKFRDSRQILLDVALQGKYTNKDIQKSLLAVSGGKPFEFAA